MRWPPTGHLQGDNALRGDFSLNNFSTHQKYSSTSRAQITALYLTRGRVAATHYDKRAQLCCPITWDLLLLLLRLPRRKRVLEYAPR